jgi:hypothetical protein
VGNYALGRSTSWNDAGSIVVAGLLQVRSKGVTKVTPFLVSAISELFVLLMVNLLYLPALCEISYKAVGNHVILGKIKRTLLVKALFILGFYVFWFEVFISSYSIFC